MSIYIPAWVMVLVGVPIILVLLVLAFIGFFISKAFWR